MKRIVTLLCICLMTIVFTSCSEIKHKELFRITDKYAESLYTQHRSYGLGGKNMEYTSDGEYSVMPLGRLINVRIERYVSDKDYDCLLEDLQSHYKKR